MGLPGHEQQPGPDQMWVDLAPRSKRRRSCSLNNTIQPHRRGLATATEYTNVINRETCSFSRTMVGKESLEGGKQGWFKKLVAPRCDSGSSAKCKPLIDIPNPYGLHVVSPLGGR